MKNQVRWGWPLRFLSAGAYDQGHQDGFKEGYKEGQDCGHKHGACEHSHPFDGALAALGVLPEKRRGSGWDSYYIVG